MKNTPGNDTDEQKLSSYLSGNVYLSFLVKKRQSRIDKLLYKHCMHRLIRNKNKPIDSIFIIYR